MSVLLKTDNLSIGYANPRRAHRIIARHMNLRLYAGELVCLLGANGSGKSTLLRTLAGMQAPLQGSVSLSDTDLHRMTAHERACRLSVVLTERSDLGALTARAVVALGRYPHTDWMGRLKPSDEIAIDQALHAVGATALSLRLFHELSDGERQKVSIARALTQEPQLLLLDEPTAFLDLPLRVEIMSILRRLARETGCAVLLSTHDLDLALRSADQLWLLPPDGDLRTGMPEELVLSGAFQATFPSKSVHFDPYVGHFKLHNATRGLVYISGEGLYALWTERALEREGFTVRSYSRTHHAIHDMVNIEIDQQQGQTLWRICHADSCHEYFTLSQTLCAVKQLVTAKTPLAH